MFSKFSLTFAITALLNQSLASPVSSPVANVGLDQRDSAGLLVTYYEHGDCTGEARQVRVNIAACDTPNPGFSSVHIDEIYRNIYGGPHRVTLYSKGNCGCPTCGSHGYDTFPGQCLKDLGFVGNALSVQED